VILKTNETCVFILAGTTRTKLNFGEVHLCRRETCAISKPNDHSSLKDAVSDNVEQFFVGNDLTNVFKIYE